MEKICREVSSPGLLMHELCLASRCCDILGGRRTGWRKAAHSHCIGYIREIATGAARILDGRRVSAQMLERVMGHVTRTTLVRRPLFSASSSVHKFQRAHCSKPAFLWVSGRSELKHFLGAMPLLESDWSLSWSGTVMATNACEDGQGVRHSRVCFLTGFFWGRLSERHRFRCQSAVQGRRHALADLDPLTAIKTVEGLSGKCKGL